MTGCLIGTAESHTETTAAEAAVGSYRCSELTSRRVGALERCLQWEVPYQSLRNKAAFTGDLSDAFLQALNRETVINIFGW